MPSPPAVHGSGRVTPLDRGLLGCFEAFDADSSTIEGGTRTSVLTTSRPPPMTGADVGSLRS